MQVVVVEHVTLDGVMQGPGRPDEDTRDGFDRGGWASSGAEDPDVAAALGESMDEGFSWLFGRRSYDGMLGHWNEVGGPFATGLNDATKYVATSDAASLRWPHTVALGPDVPAAVGELRERPGGALVVMGSGELVRALLPHGLVDELLLLVHPVVLGAGRRLFGPGESPVELPLVAASVSAGGVAILRHRR